MERGVQQTSEDRTSWGPVRRMSQQCRRLAGPEADRVIETVEPAGGVLMPMTASSWGPTEQQGFGDKRLVLRNSTGGEVGSRHEALERSACATFLIKHGGVRGSVLDHPWWRGRTRVSKRTKKSKKSPTKTEGMRW